MQEDNWKVQWLNPDKNKWNTSWACTTEAEARKRLEQDCNYFYKHIKIRLIHWVGTIIEETQGRS